MHIELVPKIHENIKSKLVKRLQECIAIKGCVAFWTIDTMYLEGMMLDALRKAGSFYCIDIQKPTDIDRITEYVRSGATEIYLHLFRLNPKHGAQSINLLHSKIMLFDLDNDCAEIWVGSHNMTNYAIQGINLEASVIIKCKREDDIYVNTLKYLFELRKPYCSKFDLNNIEMYKLLQKRNAMQELDLDNANFEILPVVTLVGNNMTKLKTEEGIIQLLSLKDNPSKTLEEGKSDIYLHTLDIATLTETLYKCKIEQRGTIDIDNPKLDVDFVEARRFAYVGTGVLSFLKPSMKVERTTLTKAKYFVNLSLKKTISHFEIYAKPSEEEMSVWQTAIDSPYHQKGSDDEYPQKEGKSIEKFYFKSDESLLPSFNADSVELDYIQKAVFEKKIKPNKVELLSRWLKFQRPYDHFYKDLEWVLQNGYQEEAQVNLFEEDLKEIFDSKNTRAIKDDLLKFLERINKNIVLSEFAKVLVERIVVILSQQELNDNTPPSVR